LDRVIHDVEEAQESLVRTTLPPAVAATAALGAAALCWWIEPAAGAALGLGAAATGGLAWLAVVGAHRVRSRRTAARRSDLTTIAVDLIDGADEALVYGRSGDLLARAAAADAAVLRSERHAAWATGLGSAVVALGTGVTLWLVLRAGISAAGTGLDAILPGVMAIVALAAFEPIALLPRAAAGAPPAHAARQRLDDLTTRPDPVAVPKRPRPLPATATFELDSVSVRAGASWALRDVDLAVRPGRSVALVGPSGAGKTTLAEVLLRFRPLDEGTYRIGGIDAELLDPAEVRTLIGLADEGAHLVAGTVLDNLRLAVPDVGRDRAEAVLCAVGLSDWLAGLERGLDTAVGTRGAEVSGGERRRIAVARALLYGFAVLIVDEPTAGLDPAAARRVVAEILDASAGRGVVLITHGAEGLEAVDEIVVLADGHVVERGSHSELLAAGGPYASGRAR
jgi:ABC-type transport system involved in cytochrome bd biosynthesis fused ATPase/permease subunit